MGKGSKGLNPADAFRKEQKKKDQKKQKIGKSKARELNNLMNNPSKIEEEIRRVQRESDSNKLDKGLKDRVRELKAMHTVAMRKVHNREEALGITSSNNTSTSAAAAPTHAPEESVYYHPTFNPTGAPPPGEPPKYRTSVPYTGPPAALPPAPMEVIYGHTPHAPPPPPGIPPGPSAYYTPPMPPPAPYAPVVPRQLEIGGRYGVPLPPPRPPGPPPQYSTPLTPQQRLQQQQQIQRQQQHTIDPLNPAAPGYTKQFGRQSQRKQQAPVPVEDTVQFPAPRPDNYTPSTITAAPTVTAAPIEPITSSAPPTVVEQPSPTPSATPEISAPSIADIMRRRHMILDENAGPAMPVYAPEAGPSLPDPEDYVITGPQMPSSDPNGHSFGSPRQLEKPKGPKVIKADSALVSLVPAALRVKRPQNNTSQPSRPPATKIRRVEEPIVSDSIIESSRPKEAVAARPPVSSVDDAYAAFMSEIQELGAFEE